jgi:anaerobic magnesium-protoporphyrin IX monomethyl ester cyclase
LKTVLINHQGLKLTSGIQIQTPSPPIGLAYIGAFIKKCGYEYISIDACGEALDQVYRSKHDKDLTIQGLTIEEIIGKIPDDVAVVGLTSLFSHSWFLVKDIAIAIKKSFPNVLIVVGGEHPTAATDMVLDSGVIDIVVIGEGEETFVEILDCIKHGKKYFDLSGIAYLDVFKNVVFNEKRKRIRNIDDFPYPDWDQWSIREYIDYGQVTGINLGRAIPILGSRGCPYECTFCSNKNMWTKRYIMRDGGGIVKEMSYMKVKYNVSVFNFMDSTFIINKSKIAQFCKELIKSELNVEYQLPAGTRSEALTADVIGLLEQSGLRNIALAPESGSEMIRDIVKKKINYDSFIATVRSLNKSKITTSCFVVIGFPEDNYDTLKESLKMIRKLAFLGVDDITVSQFTPYPGSQYYQQLVISGKIDDQYDRISDIVSFYSSKTRNYAENIKDGDLYKIMLRMYVEFYVLSFLIRPWRVFYNFYIYMSSKRENTKYVRFFSELFFIRKRFSLNTKDE